MMNVKKQLASLAVIGMMSMAAAASAFASGVGYVNFDTLISSHKDYPKVSAQMQAAIKKADEEFSTKSANMKTDQEKRDLARQLNQRITDLENKLVVPMEKDVVQSVEKVRKEKNLDCIVVQGSIIAGFENATDQTQDVVAVLKK
ncbi:OmpH family outer membrane protein [uncultured Megasphaera sp.]|uniref:OmpH family outer membrane protein n=1 Tax=uncultured Megasphaera sp. TaxID=165188 RepID=UPI003467D469